jgi:hypothetical protein
MRALVALRTARLRGEFHRYQCCAAQSVAAIQRYCIARKVLKVRMYRSVLFWKYYRSSAGLRHWAAYALHRRRKRQKLREARAAYDLSQQTAACTEFLRVAASHTSKRAEDLQRLYKDFAALLSTAAGTRSYLECSGNSGGRGALSLPFRQLKEKAARFIWAWLKEYKLRRKLACPTTVSSFSGVPVQQSCLVARLSPHPHNVFLPNHVDTIAGPKAPSCLPPTSAPSSAAVATLARAKPRPLVHADAPMLVPSDGSGSSCSSSSSSSSVSRLGSRSRSIEEQVAQLLRLQAQSQDKASISGGTSVSLAEAKPYAYLAYGTAMQRPTYPMQSVSNEDTCRPAQPSIGSGIAASGAQNKDGGNWKATHESSKEVVTFRMPARKVLPNSNQVPSNHVAQASMSEVTVALKGDDRVPLLIMEDAAQEKSLVVESAPSGSGTPDAQKIAVLRDILLFIDEFKHLL